MNGLPPELVQSIPPKWLVYLNAALVVSFALGRIYTSLSNNGGLRGVFKSIWLGSTTVTKPTWEEPR